MREERDEIIGELVAGIVLLSLLIGGAIACWTWWHSPGHRLAQRLGVVEQEREACAWTCRGQDAEACLDMCSAIARDRIEGETTLVLNEAAPVQATAPAR